MEVLALSPDKLLPFVDRIRKTEPDRYDSYLNALLVHILSDLGEFVPSGGACLLLDYPAHNRDPRREEELTIVAAFGDRAQTALGRRVPSSGGIIGETYTLGRSLVRKATPRDPIALDRSRPAFLVETVVAVPLKIESLVFGVLVLFNKREPVGYTIRDLKLAEIFGGYVATSVQNAIDAKRSIDLSKRDDLTGLANDRHFHRQLMEEIILSDEDKTPLSMLFLDLDNFKTVNDLHGHLVGSMTLKEIGFVLREVVTSQGATIARYGGDEYVVILPNVTARGAAEIAEAIRSAVAGKLFMIDGGERDGSFVNIKGVLSASIGVASLHEHVGEGGRTKDRKNALMMLADKAMYQAKDAGKNRTCLAQRLPSPL